MAGEGPILLAAEGEEVSDEISKSILGKRHAGLGQLAELQIEIREKARVGRGG
jgi:hypothetical protein